MRRSYEVPITDGLSLIHQQYLLNAVLVTHYSISAPFVVHLLRAASAPFPRTVHSAAQIYRFKGYSNSANYTNYRHTQRRKAFSASTLCLSNTLSHSTSGHARGKLTNKATKTGHTTQHVHQWARSSQLLPLDLVSMPAEAQYNKKFPRINPTQSSHIAPATNEARETPPGPAASSPNECKSVIVGWPKRP
jgi:hypothetical protein